MRRFAVVLVLAALVALLLTRAEPLAPSVTLETPVDFVGRATPVRIVARDRGSGLAHVEMRLVPEGGQPVVVASEDYPRRSWLGSGVHEAVLAPTLDAGAAHVREGRAQLEIWASDHSWLAAFRREPRLRRAVAVDVTPPLLEVMPGEHVARVGGSECAVYRVGPDAVRSGVQVGDEFFPGVAGYFADSGLRVAVFALPQHEPDARPAVLAADAAGNARTVNMGVKVTPRRFAEKTMPVTDDFLSRKVPELLAANNLDQSGDLVEGYLRINRELRAATEVRVRQACRDSAPTPLWQDAFLRLPNSAPLSGFADRRSYVHDGKTIDQQTHLGFDLASLRGSPVPAANAGRVVFAGPLGIYGNAVIIDHGLGVFSLYGHLSEIGATAGAQVGRGDTIGKTGDTGLAAGDHLHFSMMIHGVHVDPVEWWDAHWMQDHVEMRLAEYPRAASGGPRARAASRRPPPRSRASASTSRRCAPAGWGSTRSLRCSPAATARRSRPPSASFRARRWRPCWWRSSRTPASAPCARRSAAPSTAWGSAVCPSPRRPPPPLPRAPRRRPRRRASSRSSTAAATASSGSSARSRPAAPS